MDYRRIGAVLAVAAGLCALGAMAAGADALDDAVAAHQAGDWPRALLLLKPLAQEGDDEARNLLGWMYAHAQGVPQNDAEAVAQYLKAAEKGNADAQIHLGDWYRHGRGEDYAEAVRWYRKAADQGYAVGQYHLGMAYRDGRGIAPDAALAARWLALAAQQGLAAAQYQLGVMSRDGHGTPRNEKEAVRWLRKAAEQGFAAAQSDLGTLYRDGKGVHRDGAQAMAWYRKAADQGWADGQFLLGAMHAEGRGEVKDDAEAVQWYRKAAEQGSAAAQCALGMMLAKGRGVAQDEAEAARWLRKSADQGLAVAQYQLGYLYAVGKGVLRDDGAAYGWFSLAATRIAEAQPFVHQQESKLTPEQLSKAQAWLHAWKPAFAVKPVDAVAATAGPVFPPPSGVAVAVPPDAPSGLRVAVPPRLQTRDEWVDISGRVLGGSPLVTLTVNGAVAPLARDGSFTIKRPVPIGESDIAFDAVNERGQHAVASVRVKRGLAGTVPADYPPLDPSRIKAAARPNAVALVIGIDEYAQVPRADFAEDDARRFHDYAVHALGVPIGRIQLLTGPSATRLGIRKALQTWVKPLLAQGHGDVFVYFSGHGLASPDGKDLFLLPYDGDRAVLAESALRRKELIADLMESGAGSVTLFLDTCYSGATRTGESLLPGARPVLLVAKDEDVPANVTILAAAANDQISSVLEPAKHGLFSYFLMRGLEGEAAGSDHVVTAGTLATYLSNHVAIEAARLGRLQTPQLTGDASRVLSAP